LKNYPGTNLLFVHFWHVILEKTIHDH